MSDHCSCLGACIVFVILSVFVFLITYMFCSIWFIQCAAKKHPLKLFAFSEQPLGIWTRNFTHLLPVHSDVKVPKGISLSLTTTKLLDCFCNHVVISHVQMQQNVRRTKGARFFCLRRKTLSFEQHDKQLAMNCENSKCLPSAFTHAFNLLLKFLTALLMASCPRSPAVTAWV